MGDLESFKDALWLQRCRGFIENYKEQHGGRCEAAILVTAQLRAAHNLPTLVQKADLMTGYDIAWRQGTLVHLAEAGVKGRDWLY